MDEPRGEPAEGAPMVVARHTGGHHRLGAHAADYHRLVVDRSSRDHAVRDGERAQRQVTLTDGSSVALNTDTRLTVEFSRDQRSIRLDRGEAWFTVSHDERRPFTVQVENSTIRDIGTQFIVNKSPEDVLVSVLEGTVEVKAPEDRADTPMPRPAILHAGQQLSYGTDGRMSDIRVFDQDRVGSWKEGKLVFRSQPLKQVLEEIARYRPEDIRLLDQTLNELPVSGVFNIQELDHAIETLQAALPIHAEHVRDNLILIERAPAELQSRALSKGEQRGRESFLDKMGSIPLEDRHASPSPISCRRPRLSRPEPSCGATAAV